MSDDRRDSSHFSWTNIALIGAVIASLGSGGWTIFQSQFVYTQKDMELIRHDLERRETEIKSQLEDLRTTRTQLVTLREYIEFKDRVSQYMSTPFLSRPEFTAWQGERNMRLDDMTARITSLSRRINDNEDASRRRDEELKRRDITPK